MLFDIYFCSPSYFNNKSIVPHYCSCIDTIRSIKGRKTYKYIYMHTLLGHKREKYVESSNNSIENRQFSLVRTREKILPRKPISVR